MIVIARTRHTDAGEACAELAALLPSAADLGLLVFFCSSNYDQAALAEALNARFAGVQTIGCTTAGEIAPDGYGTAGMVAIGFPAAVVTAACGLLADLACPDPASCRELTQSLLQAVEARAPQAGPGNTFALLLIDGMSQREEPVTRALQRALGGIALFGGSAGDDQRFAATRVFHGGRFHPGAAVLAVVNTGLPFKIFKTQHFVQGEEKLVVTEADTATRSVREINGRRRRRNTPASSGWRRTRWSRRSSLRIRWWSGSTAWTSSAPSRRPIRTAASPSSAPSAKASS